MQAEVENNDGWKLQSLQISHYSWEKDSPYKGKITFTNKTEEAMSFNIPQDKMAALLALIADSVVDSANRLGHRMADSIVKTVQKAQAALEAPAVEETQQINPENLDF